MGGGGGGGGSEVMTLRTISLHNLVSFSAILWCYKGWGLALSVTMTLSVVNFYCESPLMLESVCTKCSRLCNLNLSHAAIIKLSSEVTLQ